MVKLCDNSKIRLYEYIYMFVMVIYMSQMTSTTTRMIAGLSAPWLPFVFPIILTFILLLRNPINFANKNLGILLIISAIWTILVSYHKKLYSASDLSFVFFLFYAIIIAFVHIKVYGKKLFSTYETIIVLLCKISIPLWLISITISPLMSSLASFFPETNLGHNILFIYNFINPSREHFFRNSGSAWEPGRFAIMILLAIYCNLNRNGLKLKNNSGLIWLIVTLGSTMSTTGYSIALLMFAITLFKNTRFTSKIIYTIFLLPIIAGLFSLDFMGNKIEEQLEVDAKVKKIKKNTEYYNSTYRKGEYVSSLGRFESIYFELENVKHDPILGYGRDFRKSYFNEKISSNLVLTGGIIKILGMYGILFGSFIYYLLYKSSQRISQKCDKKLLFVTIVLSTISYEIFVVPIFTAFWLYGYFTKGSNNKSLSKT